MTGGFGSAADFGPYPQNEPDRREDRIMIRGLVHIG